MSSLLMGIQSFDGNSADAFKSFVSGTISNVQSELRKISEGGYFANGSVILGFKFYQNNAFQFIFETGGLVGNVKVINAGYIYNVHPNFLGWQSDTYDLDDGSVYKFNKYSTSAQYCYFNSPVEISFNDSYTTPDLIIEQTQEEIDYANNVVAQMQQAEYLNWLNNSPYVANLRAQENIDPTFYWNEDHGISDNTFWYTFETGQYTENGYTNIQETQPFVPSSGGETSVSGDITVKMDWGTPPQIQLAGGSAISLDVGTNKLPLEIGDSKLGIDTTNALIGISSDGLEGISVPINIPVGTTLDVSPTGEINLNTEGAYVVVNTDGLAIPIEKPAGLTLPVEVGTQKIVLDHDLPANISVTDSMPNQITVVDSIPNEITANLDTSNASVDLNTTDKFVDLVTDQKSVDLNTEGKLLEVDTNNKTVGIDTTNASVTLDGELNLTTENLNIEMSGVESKLAQVVEQMTVANEKRSFANTIRDLRHQREYKDDGTGIRDIERKNAEFQDKVNNSKTSEGLDREGREKEAFEQQFNKTPDETGMGKGHFLRLKNSGYYVGNTVNMYNELYDYEIKGSDVKSVTYIFDPLKILNEQFGFKTDYDNDLNGEFDQIADIHKKTVSSNEMDSKPETVETTQQ